MAAAGFNLDETSIWYRDFIDVITHEPPMWQGKMMETIKNSQVVGRIRMGLANHPGHTAVLAPVSVQHALVNGTLTQEDIDQALADTIKAKEEAIQLQLIEDREFDREQKRVKKRIKDLIEEIWGKARSASIDAARGVDYSYARTLTFEIRELTEDLITTICNGKEDGVINYTISGE